MDERVHSADGRTLYDPRRDERDACGIGFVADVRGRPSRAVLDAALGGLERLRHRGAVAADARTGDGAGVLLPLPDGFFGAQVPAGPGRVGVAMAFLPAGQEAAKRARRAVEESLAAEDLTLARWRVVPVEEAALGDLARATAPRIEQAVFLAPGTDDEAAERRCFRAGRAATRAARAAGAATYLASCSTRTVTYKALCAADQLAAFYPDLTDPALAVPFAIFHQRYSTNTTPSWERAQPFRFLCHNGEINTLDGNEAWMRAREGNLGAAGVGLAAEELLRPVLDPDGSDSAKLDNAVELLVRGGRDVCHALAMLVPAVEPSPEGPGEDHALRDFYRYHACLTEPWDGPAGLVFTDGRRVGAALDRNGLRPLRWEACDDGLVVCASEAGAVDTAGRGRVRRGRLGPGQMLCVDPERGLLTDAEIKAELAAARPWSVWVAEQLGAAEPGAPVAAPTADGPQGRALVAAQVAYGFTRELITTVLRPMATAGKEPTASMGDDTPPAVLGATARPVGHYLRQRFAQVTNPPIDHLRERHVLSKRTLLGRRRPLLREDPEAARLVALPSFVLTPNGLEGLADPALGLAPRVLDATWQADEGPGGLRGACLRLGEEAVAAVLAGAGLLIVSDAAAEPDGSGRGADGGARVAVPSLLAVGAVQQRLLRRGLATRTSLAADTGEPCDSHQAAALLGYGADAICPRLTLATVAALAGDEAAAAQDRYVHALEEGVFKVMSKMGISVLDAYRGAQIFEAVGLDDEVVEVCFAGTASPLGGLGFDELACDALDRHRAGAAAVARLEHPG
ncbi:MAG TPA: glutamate synthase central domain-containing protein, partial [Actinomycetota bacterium]|nr:glutamate synthase central domain-containing protein [Actinomycetota bacterium]